jgi:hypothetical protein
MTCCKGQIFDPHNAHRLVVITENHCMVNVLVPNYTNSIILHVYMKQLVEELYQFNSKVFEDHRQMVKDEESKFL